MFILFLPLRCVNLFNHQNNPVKQAGWTPPPMIMMTTKLRLKEVLCPSDDKNSGTHPSLQVHMFRPRLQCPPSIPQLPLGASLTRNKLGRGLLSSPGMVALAISRLLGAMLKKCPLGDCRMILPQFQCIRKKVLDSSGCPLATNVLWHL